MSKAREYRGMRTDNGEWVYGAYVSKNWYPSPEEFDYTGTVVEESNIISYADDCLWVAVIPETVGQDTGMKDKNGKSVFDGDIVKTRDDVYFCVWDEYNYEYMFRNEKEDFGIAYVSSEDVEIIGTVYKNPELLGGM